MDQPIPIVCTDWEARALRDRRLTILRRPAVEGECSPFGEQGAGIELRVQERFLWPAWENQQDLVCYAADYADPRAALRELSVLEGEGTARWTRARGMPSWASRLFLRVLTLEMTPLFAALETATKEGVVKENGRFGLPGLAMHADTTTALIARWEADHGQGAWRDDAWTWAAEIEIVKCLNSPMTTKRRVVRAPKRAAAHA